MYVTNLVVTYIWHTEILKVKILPDMFLSPMLIALKQISLWIKQLCDYLNTFSEQNLYFVFWMDASGLAITNSQKVLQPRYDLGSCTVMGTGNIKDSGAWMAQFMAGRNIRTAATTIMRIFFFFMFRLSHFKVSISDWIGRYLCVDRPQKSENALNVEKKDKDDSLHIHENAPKNNIRDNEIAAKVVLNGTPNNANFSSEKEDE